MPPTPHAARLSRDDRIAAIAAAVSDLDLRRYDAWNDVAGLSAQTTVAGLQADHAGIMLLDDGRFRGILTAYVVLKYAGSDDGDIETSDAFEGTFEGPFDNSKPIIDMIKADTTPFYE